MTAIEIARRLAELNQIDDARKAYTLALEKNNSEDPTVDFEAASYLFFSGGDHEIAYTYFASLYNSGHYRDELFDLMVNAFYVPNLKPQQHRYVRNCKLLAKYKYLFRKDFPSFDELPIKFFPFNDEGYLPFDTRENHFGSYVNFNDTVVSRNFFADLTNPIFAADVYSQYELEYLTDNVRPSEWVARENHIYLHYTDWATFCSYLQCLDLRELLKCEKLVFLIEEEKELYPIDFKARFGIDYSQNTVKPIGLREIKRLIWHTQLSGHNGGDFFNEIFYGHPNLLADDSRMFDRFQERIKVMEDTIREAKLPGNQLGVDEYLDYTVFHQLMHLKNLTDKDIMVAYFLGDRRRNQGLDLNARIVPALFFQPHFSNILYTLTAEPDGSTIMECKQYAEIQASPLFQSFKYIKTFTPMRRITTSYAATVRFMKDYDMEQLDGRKNNNKAVVGNALNDRMLSRSFMVDWQDRLYHDSTLVRFEDGKLNPKATFTALAAFLDIPYTESMTYCSGITGLNPESLPGNDKGFNPAAIYRTYDEYAGAAERCLLEYFQRDAYEAYGYSFHYYDGKPMDEARVRELIDHCDVLYGHIRESLAKALRVFLEEKYQGATNYTEEAEAFLREKEEKVLANCANITAHTASILLRNLHFLNKNGQPLRMMPLLKLDPALLEQPLYH